MIESFAKFPGSLLGCTLHSSLFRILHGHADSVLLEEPLIPYTRMLGVFKLHVDAAHTAAEGQVATELSTQQLTFKRHLSQHEFAQMTCAE